MPTYNFEQTLHYFWDRKLPVSIEKLAAAHNLTLKPSDQLSLERDIGAKYSIINGCYIGEYNAFDHIARQQYAKAYLLVRHILKSEAFEVNETDMLSRGNHRDNMRVWVRKKALSLLMPSLAIDYLIQEQSITSPKLLAKFFNVAEVDLRDRLVDLKWLPVSR